MTKKARTFKDAVEISEEFRTFSLGLRVRTGDKTVNKILLINVIYFLDPLPYLEEFKRMLKTDGVIFIAGKFGSVGGFESI